MITKNDNPGEMSHLSKPYLVQTWNADETDYIDEFSCTTKEEAGEIIKEHKAKGITATATFFNGNRYVDIRIS
jgi:hypothetical protein